MFVLDRKRLKRKNKKQCSSVVKTKRPRTKIRTSSKKKQSCKKTIKVINNPKACFVTFTKEPHLAGYASAISEYLKFYHEHKNSDPDIDEKLIRSFKQEFLPDQITPKTIVIDEMDKCTHCFKPVTFSAEDGMLYCMSCGLSCPKINTSEAAIAFGDEMSFASFRYLRIDHFSDYFIHIQAKESALIADDVIYEIISYLVDEGHCSRESIEFADVLAAQHALPLKKNLYDQTMQIWCRIRGIEPFRMDPVIEEIFRLMFIRVEVVFERIRLPTRRNFLSYPYVIYKFCQQTNYTELMPYLSLLKSKVKLYYNEYFYEKICVELGWEFIPLPTNVLGPLSTTEFESLLSMLGG